MTEQELFEESALGVLSSRQSTNFCGHRQYTIGPEKSAELANCLREMNVDGVLDGAQYSHIILSRPYRTPFTFLLTFVGHKSLSSLFTVPLRAWRKKYAFIDDIPTIGYLPTLHLGILADAMERAAVLASAGKRFANVFIGPFASKERRLQHKTVLKRIEKTGGSLWPRPSSRVAYCLGCSSGPNANVITDFSENSSTCGGQSVVFSI